METVIVYLIITIAAVYCIRRFVNVFKGKKRCDCDSADICNMNSKECKGIMEKTNINGCS